MDDMEMNILEVDDTSQKFDKTCGELQSVSDSLKELNEAVDEIERLVGCLQQYNSFEG